jgi:hypothetical protein
MEELGFGIGKLAESGAVETFDCLETCINTVPRLRARGLKTAEQPKIAQQKGFTKTPPGDWKPPY